MLPVRFSTVNQERCAGIGYKLQQDGSEQEGRLVPPSVAATRCGHPGFHLRPALP